MSDEKRFYSLTGYLLPYVCPDVAACDAQDSQGGDCHRTTASAVSRVSGGFFRSSWLGVRSPWNCVFYSNIR